MLDNLKNNLNAGPVIGLAFAFSGAVIATLLHLPAAALLGSTLAVTLAAMARLGPTVPPALRNFGIAVIGGTLGAGITPHFFQDVLRYPLSLGFLALSMVATMLLCSAILKKGFGQSRDTALLATSPGALSYSLSIAADGRGDIRSIMVLQSLRLLLITLLLPPALAMLGHVDSAPAHSLPVLGFFASLVVLGLSALGGLILQRLNAPAAWLLAGLLMSGFLHGTGLVSGRFAQPVAFIGFALAGAVIGSRFAGITLHELKRLGVAGMITTGVAVAISAVLATAAALITGIPFPQMWIAFAPGGVEGMSAMALALNLDPIFVATHHIFRILSLIVLLPLFLSR